MDKLPKDLAAAKRGYEAFYDEQPNIWFEDLAYNYQMRWVRAARAIMQEHKDYKGPGRPNGHAKPEKGQVAIDYKNMTPEAFLEKYAPKPEKGGKRNFMALPPATRNLALRASKSIANKAWAAKQK